MTTKKITLSDKKVTEIERGTVLKRGTDLFIVAEIQEERLDDPIHNALFLSHPPKPYVRRERVEGEFTLISLSTGANYFRGVFPLQGLLRKISDHGRFEVVNSIEFKEVQ
jgi:hypothetical protein